MSDYAWLLEWLAWKARHTRFGRYAHKPTWVYVGVMGGRIEPTFDIDRGAVLTQVGGPPADYDRKCAICWMEN